MGPGAQYDAVVVGGGPAGLSAATWLARHRRRVLVLDGGERRNRWADRTHGYLGMDPVDPAVLVSRARQQLRRYPEAEIRPWRAERAGRAADGTFTLEAGDGAISARRLILATGVEDRFPEVEAFFEHYGASVFHCPTCDGYEARDCDVVAFGWSEDVTGFALELLGWARSVTVVTDGHRFEGDDDRRRQLAARGVVVLEDDAVELLGRRGHLEGVRLRDRGAVPCQVAFFTIAHVPVTALAEELGCALTGEGCIQVDDQGATSVPGVFAAGDVTPGFQLVQVAAAKGTLAGVACAQSLQSGDEVPEGWKGHLQ